MDRNYDWSKFTKASLYGVPTPHDNSGTGVRNAMYWLHIARRCIHTYIHTYIQPANSFTSHYSSDLNYPPPPSPNFLLQ